MSEPAVASNKASAPRRWARRLIAVASWERFKGGQRIEFLCGGRALKRFRVLRDGAAGGMRLLSVAPQEIPSAIERLQADAKDQKRAMALLQTELARYRADELAAGAEATSRGRLLLRAVDADANGLKSLAQELGAPDFARVRVGVGRPDSTDPDVVASYVLSSPSRIASLAVGKRCP